MFLICANVTPEQLWQTKSSINQSVNSPSNYLLCMCPNCWVQFPIKQPPRAGGGDTGTVPTSQSLRRKEAASEFHCKSFLLLLKGRTLVPLRLYSCQGYMYMNHLQQHISNMAQSQKSRSMLAEWHSEAAWGCEMPLSWSIVPSGLLGISAFLTCFIFFICNF